RALGVGRAVDAGPVAVLLEVADASREAARRAGSGNRVGRAVVRDAVAAVIDVTDACRRAAHRRALDVVRTAGTRSGALLVDVADAGGGATRGPGGDEAVGGAAVADAVAALRHVADPCRCTADGRALRIRRARRARSGAGLLDVAHPCGGATDGAGSLDRAGGGAAVAV